MSRYLHRIEPEEVRFLMDFSELKELVIDMLGEVSDLIDISISYDDLEDATGAVVIRPMIHLKEIGKLSDGQLQHLFSTGLSIDDAPFENGDQVMESIFGQEYTIAYAANDADGAFFTIEMPYQIFVHASQ